MESLLITPKDKAELKLLSELLSRMNVKAKVLTEEEKEDLGLSVLMKEADRQKTVSRDTIIKKLKS